MNDPVFGDRPADEYARLASTYVHHVVRVGTGTMPADAFEQFASLIERLAGAAAALPEVPGEVVRLGLRRADRHWDHWRALGSCASYEQLQDAVVRITNHSRTGLSEYRNLVRNLLWTQEDPHVHGAGGDAGEPPLLRANEAANISWQAIALNLALRFTLKPVLARISTSGARDLGRWLARSGSLPADVTLQRVGRDDFRAEWVRLAKQRRRHGRTILYLPGGGFFFPASLRHAEFVSRLARRTRARAMLVHYRLAPDHPFPAGLEDAIAAYRYLIDSGTEARDIVVAGDSAGGGLALSLALALRQERLPLPAGVALLCPLADLSFSTPSRTYNRWHDPVLPARRRMTGFERYIGETPRDNPLLSPVFGDFAGLPPMFAQVGSGEILLDDTLRVARKARAQGVDFEVEVWDRMPHDWHLFPFIPEAGQAAARIARFFDRAWAGGYGHWSPAA
jgi:acetyl esterase/lipase